MSFVYSYRETTTNEMSLPEYWEILPFTNCLKKVKTKKKPSIPKRDYQESGEFPVIDQGALFIAGWTDSDEYVISDNLPVVIFGDHTRIFKYVDFPFALGADGTQLLYANDEILDPHFFYHALLNLKVPNKGYNRHYRYLREFSVVCPPLPEQRAIAHLLQTIQGAKSARQRELALEHERKAALMDYLFSYGTKGEPRKETEIGEIPESWKLGTIGEICERIIDYRGRTPKFSESGIVHLRSSNVKEGRLTLKNDEITYVTDETYKSFMTRGFPKAGDIIFTTEGPLGESAMVPPNFRFSLAQRMVLLRADKTVLDSSYLLYVLYSEQVRKEYLGRATGSTAKGISSKNLQQVQVPLPCLPEQREIAISLTACDAKIVVLEQEAERLDELFHAMLDELMTGQRSAITLIDTELPN